MLPEQLPRCFEGPYKCLWKRLGPLLRGLREAPKTSRGTLGSVLGSSWGVSETISDGFWTSKEVA